MPRPIQALAILPALCFVTTLIATLLTGCATYDSGYQYGTRPRGASVPGRAGPAGAVSVADAAGRLEAQVLGVREGDATGPASIDVRLRVERFGATTVAVPVGDLQLVTGDREQLGVRDVRAIGPAVAASGGAAAYQATFALPGRDPAIFDLSGLDLMIPVDVDGHRSVVRIPFQRGATAYIWADPWEWPGRDANGRPTGRGK
ncbi:MAG: hypothetical protein K8T90_13765 [Planctomycetes bacterium]|nr:hypothetical protein [Planctomycetota bacterium]